MLKTLNIMRTLTFLILLLAASISLSQENSGITACDCLEVTGCDQSINSSEKLMVQTESASFSECLDIVTGSERDSAYTFFLPELTISQIERGKEVIYVFEKKVTKFRLSDSILTADPDIYNYRVRIQDIRSITFHHGTNAGLFSLSAGAVGFLLGFAASSFGHSDIDFKDRLFGGLAGGAVFAIVGGAIGLLFTNDEYYRLNDLSAKDKHTSLLRIFKKNKINKK